MNRNIIKSTIVSAVAAVLVFAPASQAFAGSHHGYEGGYGSNGHHYGEYNYYQQAPQQYSNPAPQNYVAPKVQSSSNNFDPTIYDIQVVLYDQGYYEGNLDGLYGPATKTALLSFQSDNDIPESEDADVETLKADLTTLEALGLYTLL